MLYGFLIELLDKTEPRSFYNENLVYFVQSFLSDLPSVSECVRRCDLTMKPILKGQVPFSSVYMGDLLVGLKGTQNVIECSDALIDSFCDIWALACDLRMKLSLRRACHVIINRLNITHLFRPVVENGRLVLTRTEQLEAEYQVAVSIKEPAKWFAVPAWYLLPSSS